MKKLILPIIIFIAFFCITTNVSARAEVGRCIYGLYDVDNNKYVEGEKKETIRLIVNDDGYTEIDPIDYTTTYKINNFKNNSTEYRYFVTNKYCMQYMGITSDWGNDTSTFDEFVSSEMKKRKKIFKLIPAKETTCYYDIPFNDIASKGKQRYIRLKVFQPINDKGMYLDTKFYTYNSKGEYTDWSFAVNNRKVFATAAYAGHIGSDGAVTYNLSDLVTVDFSVPNKSESGYYYWYIMEVGSCDRLMYGASYGPNENGRQQITIGSTYMAEEGEVSASTVTPHFEGKTNTETTTPPEEEVSAPQEGNQKECNYHGSGIYTKSNSELTNHTFNYNLKLVVRDTNVSWYNEKEFCLDIGNSHQCSGSSGSIAIMVDQSWLEEMYFILANDFLKQVFDGKDVNTFTCPKDVYIKYDGKQNFEFTLDSTAGTKIEEGIGDEPTGFSGVDFDFDVVDDGPLDPGTEVSGCGVLGTEFKQYLKSILGWIQILGPILALVLSMVDITRAVASGEDDAKTKAFKSMKTRIIAAILLVLVPFIIELLINLVGPLIGGPNCTL